MDLFLWCHMVGLYDDQVPIFAHFSPHVFFKTQWFIKCPLIFISRFLLKSLLQYQSLSEGEILSTPSLSSHPPVPPVAITSSSAGGSSLSGGHNLVSVSTGEEGPLKKPKKERKERSRENGKEERECYGKIWIQVLSDNRWNYLFSRVCSVPKKMSKNRKLADGSRKLVQPIPLDSSGRPVFPIVLGGLTVYSLGEVCVSEDSQVILMLLPTNVVNFWSDVFLQWHHKLLVLNDGYEQMYLYGDKMSIQSSLSKSWHY